MKLTTSTTTIAVLVAATLAAGTLAPVLAQDRGAGTPGGELALRGGGAHGDGHFLHHRRGRGGGLVAFDCGDGGSDRLEHMLLSIAQRTDPTADQQTLYDSFASTAMAAQQDFAAACDGLRPADGEAAGPDLVERMNGRLEMARAHAAAIEAVLPAFEAFYESLDDAQKQALEPRRGEQHHLRLLQPDLPVTPDLPAEPDAV